MKKILLSAIAVVLTVLGLSSVTTISPASAAVLCPDGKTTVSNYSECTDLQKGEGSGSRTTDLMTTLNTVINVVLGIVGFVAVVMIILGGISYITSQGDTAKTTKGRNTILYGVIGLIIALLAFAIVNFVLGNVFTSNS